MRKLILIKHASPLVDPNKSSEHWHLSEKGKAACEPLAEALRSHELVIVMTSTEPKASETAELIASRLSIPTETAPDLHEHDRSNVPHMRSGEFISHIELFFRRPDELVLGQEAADDVLDRFETALEDVLKKHTAGNIAIVTHGTVLALFVAQHSQRKPFDLWREMGLPSYVVLTLPDFELIEIVPRLPS